MSEEVPSPRSNLQDEIVPGQFNDPAKVFGPGEAPVAWPAEDDEAPGGLLNGQRICPRCLNLAPEDAYCTATPACQAGALGEQQRINRENTAAMEISERRRVERERLEQRKKNLELINPPQMFRLDDYTLNALAEMLNPPPEVRNKSVEPASAPDDERDTITIPRDDLRTLLAEHRYDAIRTCKCRTRGRLSLFTHPNPRSKWEVHVLGLLSMGLSEVRRHEEEVREQLRRELTVWDPRISRKGE